MITDNIRPDYKELFALPAEHSLRMASSHKVKRKGTLYETRWFDEHDAQKKLVARFRTWTNRSLQPPYKKQLGWERYSLSGKLLDREVRYSKRETMEYLH